MLSGSSFEGADLTDADFSDSYMGDFDQRNLCKNPTLKGTNPKTGNDSRCWPRPFTPISTLSCSAQPRLILRSTEQVNLAG